MTDRTDKVIIFCDVPEEFGDLDWESYYRLVRFIANECVVAARVEFGKENLGEINVSIIDDRSSVIFIWDGAKKSEGRPFFADFLQDFWHTYCKEYIKK